MPRDCYAQVFRPVYAQAIADGLAVTVATAAAQSAMADCLKQQSEPIPAVQPIVSVPGSSQRDPGPTMAGGNRSDALGAQQ
jgi:hypothetical protein